MRVGKEFTFHAAHRDATASADDQCGRLHGHTYKVSAEVSGPLDARGMVVHGDLLKEWYRTKAEPLVEHQYLNETMDFNPTMEAMCEWFKNSLQAFLMGKHLEAGSWYLEMTLWETPTMYATSRGGFTVEPGGHAWA